MTERRIFPVLDDGEYNKCIDCFLTPEMGPHQIQPNVVYKDSSQIKFLLLPDALSSKAYDKALRSLKRADFQKSSRRAAYAQKQGGKLTLGWIFPHHPKYKNIRSAPTLEQARLLADLYPLVREMDAHVHKNIRKYYDYAQNAALSMERQQPDPDDLSRITDPTHYRIVNGIDPWDMTYTIRGTVFSTLEINRNNVFKAHEDGGNVPGTCVCISALGEFAGGRLVFPRYGYSAELGPKDLLICDNNHELHGNLGPIVGERFSVVAFLHESLRGIPQAQRNCKSAAAAMPFLSDPPLSQ